MDLFVASFLVLEQELSSNVKIEFVEQVLQLADSVTKNLTSESTSDRLLLQQSIAVFKTLNLEVSNELVLSQETFPRVFFESIAQGLVFGQELSLSQPAVTTPLELGQAATGETSKPATSVLVLSQAVEVSVTKNLTASNELDLVQTMNGYKPNYYFIIQ